MILCDVHTPFEHNTETVNTGANWPDDRANYIEQQIGEMRRWVNEKKEVADNLTAEQYEVADISSLNEMQRLAFDIVNSHFQNDCAKKDSLCLIITGVAGTGKSYLINALRELLQDK